MFFSRIGPFRIVWRKNFFFVDFIAGRHEIVPPEPSWGSNISRSWKGIDVEFSFDAHKVYFALSDQKWRKSVFYFLRFSQKNAIFSGVRGFSGAQDFFWGETFFRCFISILSRFWPKISKIWWVISEKSAKNLNFDRFSWILRGTRFFFENRASSLKIVYGRLTWCKKSERSNGGKYENLVGQTDWRSWLHRTLPS